MSRPVKRATRSMVLLLLGFWPTIGLALDHDNLDPNRPIGMEDAYAVPKGEIGLEAGVGFVVGLPAWLTIVGRHPAGGCPASGRFPRRRWPPTAPCGSRPKESQRWNFFAPGYRIW